MTQEERAILKALHVSNCSRNALYAAVGPMSNKMAEAALRGLERDGYIRLSGLSDFALTRAGRDAMDLRARIEGR